LTSDKGEALWHSVTQRRAQHVPRERLLQPECRAWEAISAAVRTDDTSRTTLEEGPETFLLPDPSRTVAQAIVTNVSFASFNLQTGLDYIAGCGKISGRHTGNGTGSEQLHNAKFVCLRLAEKVALQVGIGGEVDGREGN
jgi:hypothetical protein